MKKIITVGKTEIELVLSAPSLPDEGEERFYERYEMRPGGKGGAAAYLLSLFGLSSSILSRVGKDGNAARLRHFLYENGVDTGSLFTDNKGQTALSVYIKSDEYSSPRVLRYSGVSGALSEEDISKSVDSSYNWALLECCYDKEVLRYASQYMRSLGIRIIADFTGVSHQNETENEPSALVSAVCNLKEAEIVIFDKELAEALTGVEMSSVDKCFKCSMELSRIIKASHYVIKMKDRGIFVYDGKFYNIISPCDAPEREKAVYADVFASTLAAIYVLSDKNIKAACEVAFIADKIARSEPSVFIPTPQIIGKYISDNSLDIHFEV